MVTRIRRGKHFECIGDKHDASIRMHARPIRPHKFCQHNVAIAFYIGGIRSLSRYCKSSATHTFSRLVYLQKIPSQPNFPMMQFTHDSLSQFILHMLLYGGQLFIKRRAMHRCCCHTLTIGQLIMVTHLLT